MTSLSNRHIKELAALQGFDLCGITPGKHFAENEAYFKAWLEKGYNSSLGYMGRYLDRRFDVRRLVEGAQTVVVCAISYKNRGSEGYPQEFRTRVASYACTRDYHQTIKEMLSALFEALQQEYPEVKGRCFVDTARCWRSNWPSKPDWAGSDVNRCSSLRNSGLSSYSESWY